MLGSTWIKHVNSYEMSISRLQKLFIKEVIDEEDDFSIDLNKLTRFYISQPKNYNLVSKIAPNLLVKQEPLKQNKLASIYLRNTFSMQSLKINHFRRYSKGSFRLNKQKINEHLAIQGEFKLYSKELLRRRYGWANENALIRIKWFRKRFKRWFSRFRKIKKHRAFASLLRSYFESLTGYSEKQMLYLWYNFRRSYDNYYGSRSLVQKFSQSLLLVPNKLILFLGFAPSRYVAKALIQSGALVINGVSSTNL